MKRSDHDQPPVDIGRPGMRSLLAAHPGRRRLMVLVGAVVAVLGLSSFGVVTCVRHQSKQLPEWFEEPEAEVVELAPSEGPADEQRVGPVPDTRPTTRSGETPKGQAKPRRTRKRQARRATLKDHKIRRFHRQTTAQRSIFAPAIVDSNLKMKSGQLEAGFVVRLDRIPRHRLSTKDRNTLNSILDGLGIDGDEAIYVAVLDSPQLRKGRLYSTENLRFKLGNLEMSLASLASTIGASPSAIRRKVDAELARLYRGR